MTADSDRSRPARAPAWGRGHRLSTFLYRRPRLVLVLLLGIPLLWLVAVYLGSLSTLILQSFFWLDAFTGQVVHTLTLANYLELTSRANLDIFVRTIVMAGAVTLACAVLAYPLAYYMARFASPRAKALLYVLVLLPLWSSYLVRVYAWRLILAREGIASWFFSALHADWLLQGVLKLPVIGGPSLSVSFLGMWLVFVYVWLPFMVLPIVASLERVPGSLLEASADLGARPGKTFRAITFPLALPGVVAGSIFTFSLTLGDFVVPYSLGNSSYFIGQAVLSLQGTAWNIPLAAAFTVVPMVVMGMYLIGARRLGAFDAL
ncbi:MAG TPA: ABC transporter permease [Anaerolineales bacterium]|nr:ABC transporter permease [Anaerolineales bacterium]